MTQNSTFYPTPFGHLELTYLENELISIVWAENDTKNTNLKPKSPHLDTIYTHLEQYFAGKITNFTEIGAKNQEKTFFQRVWSACSSIPYGETRSYQWLAAQAGSEKAVRAAGQAMARNPFHIIVPCHRVISSSGKLTGYKGGLSIKEQLLAFEAENVMKLA